MRKTLITRLRALAERQQDFLTKAGLLEAATHIEMIHKARKAIQGIRLSKPVKATLQEIQVELHAAHLEALEGLEQELMRCHVELQKMAEAETNVEAATRLRGKAEGVSLALGKLQQYRREYL